MRKVLIPMKNDRMTMMMVVVVVVIAGVHCAEQFELTGDNVCTTKVLESKLVNVSYLESVQIKKHSLCLTPPFICSDYVSTMKPRWRQENITRTVTHRLCCPGYRETEAVRCEPDCPEGCGHGECVGPGLCRCDAGHSGGQCERVGCPPGQWGPGCEESCSCEHGGWCEPVTGSCRCTPGYHGASCSLACQAGTWGSGCSQSCQCGPGLACHHVTGQCSPCPQGTFGHLCSRECSCHQEGTQLCSHLDGRCYCKGNWFGSDCHQHCPFGLQNKTCHTSALDNGACQCPNDLYTCDPVRGCVCPPGQDCGIELLDSSISLSPYSDINTSQTSNTAVITVSVLIIALVAIVLVIMYYRRRLGVMKKDLKNRSVYYSDREQTDPDRTYDLIIRDQEPYNTFTESGNVINNVSNNVLNNVVLNLDSQRFPNNVESNFMKKVNNVSKENTEQEHTDGATAAPGAAFDVNIFPLDEKSNLNQRFNPKVAKTDLEVMIRNNLADCGDSSEDDGDKKDNDSVHKLKVNLSKNNSAK